jgi:MYXO-CTERM domain-containing protein
MILGSLSALALTALLHLADPMSFEYSGQTDGSGGAYLVVRANQDLDGVEIVISGDGQTIRKQLGDMGKGQTAKISWTQKNSQAKYQLDAKGKNVDANWAFEIVKAQPSGQISKLKVRSSREDIVKRQQASFEATFDLVNYEYKIYDSDADVVAAETVPGDIPNGSTFTVKWSSTAEIFMIWVRGEDKFGRFTEYKLVPWAVEIPHTEINFDTAKWDIKNDEAPKLEEAVAVAFHELVALDKVNKAVNANLTPQLYIVGYTDTVGSAASNQKLSNHRAKSIAEFFRDKGFWAEIYYAGMGERGLRVETGDNVDEVRNRRALYLIGVQKPAGGGQIPTRWARLVGARPKPAGFTLPALPEKWKNYRDERRNAGDGTGGGDMAEELPSGGDGDGGADPIEPGSGSMAGLEYGDADGSPPPVEGEPGATKKGCQVGEEDPPIALGLFVLALGCLRARRLGVSRGKRSHPQQVT